MRFLHPEILYFLIAAVIPVIVHLLRLHRYKRIYFSNVRLLQAVQNEQKRSSRLREWLVLACRVLVFASVVVAFSQPYIPLDDRQSSVGAQTRLSIYLDNSFSMQAPSRREILLDKAKNEVRSILRAFGPDVQVQLLTNDFSGEEQNFLSPQEIEERLQDIGFNASVRSFDQICARQKRLFDDLSVPFSARVCYFVSDFQKSTFGLPLRKFTGDSLTRYVFVPVRGVDYSNLSMDSLALDMPLVQAGRPALMRAFIRNRSQEELLQVPLRLFVDGKQAGVYSVDLPAGTRVCIPVQLQFEQSGIHTGYVEIADYPVNSDDRLYFSLDISERIPVWHLYDLHEEEAFHRLFSTDSGFAYRSVPVSQLDYSSLSACRFVILGYSASLSTALTGELKKFIENGGGLLLLPPDDPSLLDPSGADFASSLLGSSWHDYREEPSQVREIATDHPVFAMAFDRLPQNTALPKVKARYALPSPSAVPYRSLMRFSSRSGDDMLREYALGKGRLYMLSAPLDPEVSDFTQNFTFVVSVLDMVLLSGNTPRLYYTISGQDGIYLPASLFLGKEQEDGYRIYSQDGSLEFTPRIERVGSEMAFFTYGQISQEGNYFIGVPEPGSGKRSHRDFRQNSRQDFRGDIRTSSSGESVPGSPGSDASSDTTGMTPVSLTDYRRIYPLSFNHNPLESEKECYSDSELQTWFRTCGNGRFYLMNPEKTDLSQSARRMNRGTELWKVFLIFALLFALCETLLLRSDPKGKKSSRNFKKKE